MDITQQKSTTQANQATQARPAYANARQSLMTLSLGALGVVYGDIGTSPLYALNACFFGTYPVSVNPHDVLGVLSLIFWSLIIVVSIKYVSFILRADNRGEGGILALLALLEPWRMSTGTRRTMLTFLGIFGAALLYGDGMITPAISVLSAIEGLKVATPSLAHYVIPLTILVLFILFVFQRQGTGKVGAIFGPVMMLWFVTLAWLGIVGIARNPNVLAAVSPEYALSFLTHSGLSGFLVLGGVFLVVTGAEALYADMGHFGRKPIRLAWFALVSGKAPCFFITRKKLIIRFLI